MTYDKKTLQELKKKVEAGDIEAAPFWKVWLPENEDGMLAYDARDAAKGSLDAAISLLEAVLPGWVIERMKSRHGGVWEVHLWELNAEGWHTDECKKVEVWNQDLSRGLLLAILSALIEEAG